MAALDDFEKDLITLIGKPTDLRPFVCDGSPLGCKAFIVGFNPATEMSADFWHFWRSGYGFDKSAWFEAYKGERQEQPLKPGKTRRKSVSNTRSMIGWIVEEASPVKILETNIYAAPTEQAVDLPSERRLTAPFDFLIESIQPRVIIAHGEDAEAYLQHKYPKAHVIVQPHFSKWSRERARMLGQRIRRECDA
jgi:hypothetical protein